MSEPTSADEAIDLVVPLDAAYASTVRIVAAAVGADLEFTVDELDDLRLGVSEVFNLLADGSPAGTRCSNRFVVRDGGVEISMSRDVGADTIELDGLASTILGSVVDEFEVANGSVVLRKRALEAQRS